MNYKYPLLNLITRGHLSVKNSIAMENFINDLDNDTCGTILEHLIYEPDTRECARRLQECFESYELMTGNRKMISESVLNIARDNILLRESDNPLADSANDMKDQASELIRLIKAGAMAVAVAKIFGMPASQRKATLQAIKNANDAVYGKLIQNPVLAKILPKDTGFYGRTMDATWKFSTKPLNQSDKQYFAKIGKGVGWSTAIAAGIITAIVGINVVYKRYFSAAAKQCKGLNGKKRTICMCEAIIAAAEKAKSESEKALLECDSAKDPQECRFKMKVEIRSWMKKIEEQKRKLAKLKTVNSKAYSDTSSGNERSNDPFS